MTTSTGKRRPPTSRQPDQLVSRTRDLQKTPLATLIKARSLPLLQAAIAVALRSFGPGMAGPKGWANPSCQMPPAMSKMNSSGSSGLAAPGGLAEMATSATAGRKAGRGCMGAQFPWELTHGLPSTTPMTYAPLAASAVTRPAGNDVLSQSLQAPLALSMDVPW